MYLLGLFGRNIPPAGRKKPEGKLAYVKCPHCKNKMVVWDDGDQNATATCINSKECGKNFLISKAKKAYG